MNKVGEKGTLQSLFYFYRYRIVWASVLSKLFLLLLLFRIIGVMRTKDFVESTFNVQVFYSFLVVSLFFVFFLPVFLKKERLVRSLGVVFLGLGVCLDVLFVYLIFSDTLREWWGSPFMMQFALFYYYHPNFWVFYFTVHYIIFNLFVLQDGQFVREQKSLYEGSFDGKKMLRDVYFLLIFPTFMVPLVLLSMYYLGFHMGVIFLMGFSLLLFMGIIFYELQVIKGKFVDSKESIDVSSEGKDAVSRDSTRKTSSSFLTESKNALLVFFSSLFDVLGLFLLQGLAWLYLFLVVRPNDFLPDLVVLFPIFLVSFMFWLIFYRFFPSLKAVFILEGVLSFILFTFYQINPYGIDIYRKAILWVSIFIITGMWGVFYKLFIRYVKGESFGVVSYLFFKHGNRSSRLDDSDVSGLKMNKCFSLRYWLLFVNLFYLSMGAGALLETRPYETGYPIVGYSALVVFGLWVIFSLRHVSVKGVNDASEGDEDRVGSNVEFVSSPVSSASHRSLSYRKGLLVSLLLFCIVAGPFLFIPAVVDLQPEEHLLGVANENDYALWYADSLRTIDRFYKPHLNLKSPDPNVYVEIARGEHEGFQVVLTPLKVPNLNVWYFRPISDLVRSDGSYNISRDVVSVYTIRYIPELGYQFPDTLDPFERVDTSRSLTQQSNFLFYVDIMIPGNDSIPAGDYSFQMQFLCRDYRRAPPPDDAHYFTREVVFTVHVKVFDFTIPLERHIGTEIIWGLPSDPSWIEFYNSYRLDAYYPPSPVVRYSDDPSNLTIEFNWTRWEEDLERGFDGGMKYFPVSWSPSGIDWENNIISEEYKILMKYYLLNITSFLKNHTTPWGTSYFDHAYFFIRDEPSEDIYDTIVLIASYIHSIVPDLRIMETMNNELSTYPDEFLEEVDIYCQHISRWFPSTSYPNSENITINEWPPRISEFLQTHNSTRRKELWVYLTGNGFPISDTPLYYPGIIQRNSFWLFWTYHIDGWLYWSFNWGLDGDSGYGYAVYGESRLVNYGIGDKPLSSLRLERIRDGIEDFEYFWLLNKTSYELLEQGHTSEAEKGFALLDSVSQIYNNPEDYDKYLIHTSKDQPYLYCYEKDQSIYLQLRHDIGLFLDDYAS